MFYGANIWDPILIIAQIITIQCLYYFSMGVLLWLLPGPYVSHLSLGHFFDWRWVAFHTFSGWMEVVAILINAFAGAVYLMLVVERAKKCLDFAATIYIVHLIACCLYRGFPLGFEWWLVHLLGLIATALVGEWLCLQRELQDIPIGQRRTRQRATAASLESPGNVQLPAIQLAGSSVLSFGRSIASAMQPPLSRNVAKSYAGGQV